MLLLDEIAWGARSASSVGARVVQSVPMEEYRVSVDLARALSAAGGLGAAAIAAAIEQELDASRLRASVDNWSG